MKERYLNMTYKEILIDVLGKVKIVDNYDQINKDYNNKVEELNAKIKELERIKTLPVKPVKQLITNETELVNFIEQNNKTPDEVYDHEMIIYNEQINDYIQLKKQIVNKYNIKDIDVKRYIMKLRNEIDYLETSYLKLKRENSILKDEIIKYIAI